MLGILERLEGGRGQAGDIARLEELANGIRGRTFCPMGDAAVSPILSGLRLFRAEYDYHIKHKHCAAITSSKATMGAPTQD
jgi:NADH:ubiquinone oxidoreductase subunit F (NADH-binding)